MRHGWGLLRKKVMMTMRKLKKYKPTAFKAKDSYYDEDAADFAVAFIENLCHTKGTWAGKPFELIDWQEQIIRDLFGILKPNGYRQFNTAYVEIPKKMGKSELAAAVALLLTCGDGEERAEVYGCAADRQQAAIVFDVAADMVRMCPALNRRVKILASQKRIIFLPTNSFYQVLSAEAYSKHGFNIHGVVFDELHTQPNRKLFDVMTKGSGDARMQPLYFLITTAGTDTHSICYETHQKAKDILEGIRETIKITSPGLYQLTDKLNKIHPMSVLAQKALSFILSKTLTGASSAAIGLYTAMILIQDGGVKYRDGMIDEKDWHSAMDTYTFTRPGYLQGKKVYNIPNENGGYDYLEVKINDDLTLDRNNVTYICSGKTKHLSKEETYQYFCEDYWTPFSMPGKYWDNSWKGK